MYGKRFYICTHFMYRVADYITYGTFCMCCSNSYITLTELINMLSHTHTPAIRRTEAISHYMYVKTYLTLVPDKVSNILLYRYIYVFSAAILIPSNYKLATTIMFRIWVRTVILYHWALRTLADPFSIFNKLPSTTEDYLSFKFCPKWF